MEKKPIISSCKRTTWTTAMDRCFIEIMADQVRDGQFLDGQFSKHAWRIIVEQFKNKFGSELTSEIMKNHYRAIKKSHSAIKTLLEESGLGWDAEREMVYADSDSVWDDYIKAHPDFRIWRTKSMAGYDQLCIIFGDGGATGKFSRAPEDKELYTEKASCGGSLYFNGEDYETQEPINLDDEPEEVNLKKRKSPIPLPNSEKFKKPRKTTGEGMVDAIQGMASAFTQMANNKVNPVLVPPTTLEGRVVAALGAIPDLASATYMLALDFLEKEKKARNCQSFSVYIRAYKNLQPEILLPTYGAHRSSTVKEYNMSNSDEEEIIVGAAAAATSLAACYYLNNISKTPCRTSILSGRDYVMDVLTTGHAKRCEENFHMEKHVFWRFCHILETRSLLSHSSGVRIEEQLAIFMTAVGHNERNRVLQERFQHSGETISRHFNNVLDAIVTLSGEFFLPAESSTPPEILQDSRFYPYFKDCVGAIDGTHVPALISSSDKVPFINRKGVTTQSVLVACSFDLQFQYVLAGWEGSATDSRILNSALTRDNKLHVPQGKYYLADGGYTNTPNFIAPHRATRYHLKEYGTMNIESY